MEKQFFKWEYLKKDYKALLKPNEEGNTLLKLILLPATRFSGSDSSYLFVYYFNPNEVLVKIRKFVAADKQTVNHSLTGRLANVPVFDASIKRRI